MENENRQNLPKKRNFQQDSLNLSGIIHQEESQSSPLNQKEPKRSPLKYKYLSAQQNDQRIRQRNVFWLECFAMFIFIYSSACAKAPGWVDLHFFVGILVAFPICAKQTGANLNPAVSLSMTFKAPSKSWSFTNLLWIYLKAQIIGAILAMAVAIYLNQTYVLPLSPGKIMEQGQIYENTSNIQLRIIISQAVGVFILIFFILYATGPYSFISTHSYGVKFFYISVFVYIGRKFAAVSANQINIALTLSRAFVGFNVCDFSGFFYLILWALGDFLGVIIAVFIYYNLTEPTLDYIQRHHTAKQMSKLQNQRIVQFKQSRKEFVIDQPEIHVLSYQNTTKKMQDKAKQQMKSGSEEAGQDHKDYYKNLQNF